jgi:hypothetical protein
MTRVATLHQQRLGGCWRHLPRPGVLLTSCCAFAACACFHVTPCSKSVSTCLAGPGVIFLRAGALQACFVLLHPCLRILLAIYSEAAACMHASAHLHCSETAEIRSACPTPSLCTFDVPCMSIFLLHASMAQFCLSWHLDPLILISHSTPWA